MIPLRDLQPTQITPVVTIGLIASNVAAFLLSWGNLDEVIWRLGAIPVHFTGLEPERVPGLPPPDPATWWTPLTALTSAWLHGGVLHIAMNMWFLWVFGDNIEERLGRVRFVVFYLACALAAVAAQVISNPHGAVPMVGASGAVSGVLGAYVRFYPHARVIGLVPLGFIFFTVVWSAGLFIGLWFALQGLSALLSVGSGASGGVAWWAHIGGFATGLLLAPVLAPKRKQITVEFGRPPRSSRRY